MAHFHHLLLTFNQATSQTYYLFHFKESLNQVKRKYIFLAFCLAKSSIMFSKFKYKISLRALRGITLRAFKNH
jgi:hypothetical protein